MSFPSAAAVSILNPRRELAKIRDANGFLGELPRFILLFVLPLIYLFTASNFVSARGPFWQAACYDPSYPYLLNSLLLLQGNTPAHIDHPGTPIQILGAGLLATKNALLDRKADLARAVIKKPEKYLEYLSSSLRWLFAVSLLLAPLWIWIRTSSFATAMAFQTAPLLNAMAFIEGGVYFKPESLINTFVLWFCAFIASDLIRHLQGHAGSGWTLERTLAALAAGACIATKMHTAPLFLIALIVAPPVRRTLLFGAIAAVSFLACTLPIFWVLPKTIAFAFQIASHTQRYGSGKPGIIDPELFWKALSELVFENWLTFALIGLFAGYHAVRLVSRSDARNIRLHAAGLFLAGIQAAFLLLVAKHPAHHYLLPLVVSLSLSIALVTYTLHGVKNRFTWAAGLTLLSLTAICLSLYKVAASARIAKANTKANIEFYERIQRDYDSSLRAGFYSCSSPEFALHFADGFCAQQFSSLINKRFPNVFFFNIFNSRFLTSNEMLTPEEMLRSHPVIYLHGSASAIDPLKKDFPDGTRFRVLERAHDQAIVEVQAGPAARSASPHAQ